MARVGQAENDEGSDFCSCLGNGRHKGGQHFQLVSEVYGLTDTTSDRFFKGGGGGGCF